MAIMDYNLSHSYALAVGHLGDRIRGGGPFVGSWPEINVDLTFAQRVDLQKRLSRLGFETGGSDGRFGARPMRPSSPIRKALACRSMASPAPSCLSTCKQRGLR